MNVSYKSGVPEKEAERARIEHLIEEASTGTRYSRYQARRSEKLQSRITLLRNKLETSSPAQLSTARAQVDRLQAELLRKKVPGKTFVHIDLDAFYATVEERDHPEWRGKPLAVGGMSMLCTANYEARKYGVSAAMPGYIAVKLCPDLLLAPLRFPAYEEASERARSAMLIYDSQFNSFSLDEASLDLSCYLSDTSADIETVVNQIREQIKEATSGLTCSAGIACNRFLAKLASNLNKPNGQYSVLNRDPHEFVLEQPIRRLWGVGKVTASILKGVLNVRDCRELWEQRHTFPLFLTTAITRNLVRCLLGISSEEDTTISSQSDPDRGSKSCETTFAAIFEPKISQVREILNGLSNELTAALVNENRKAQSISVKIKTADFDVFTRSQTLLAPTDDPQTILDTVCKLFKKCKPESVRLLGIKASKFSSSVESPPQKHTLDAFLVDTKDDSSIRCPICYDLLIDTFDSAINAHIDHCLLSKSTTNVEMKKPRGPMDKFLQP